MGYDPINDIDWLESEIHDWVFNNLKKKWSTIVRKHIATKATLPETFQGQFSGYGANLRMINRLVDRLKDKPSLDVWTDQDIHYCAKEFLAERFPTVIALNKIDMMDSDKNIDSICRKYGEVNCSLLIHGMDFSSLQNEQDKITLISALSENFLRKLYQSRYINYKKGTDHIELAEDQDPSSSEKLEPLDDKTRGLV